MTYENKNVFSYFCYNSSIFNSINAQDEKDLKLSGELLTDQRLLMKDNNDWAWNENRLSLKLDK